MSAAEKLSNEKERSSPNQDALAAQDPELTTLAEEPRPDKAEPVDIEQRKPGAGWQSAEVQEIPYK